MTTTLVDLPSELIEQTLLFLGPRDILACQLTNKFLHATISDSVQVQYHLALRLSNAQDNPLSNLPLKDKLQKLRASEKAWDSMQARFVTSVKVKHTPTGIYDLTGGTYLLGNIDRRTLHHLELPHESNNKTTQWKSVSVDRTVIDIGLCIFEYDLIAVVTTTPHPTPGHPTTHDIEISFLQYSNGQPHPLAKSSRMFIMNSAYSKPAIAIEIVGRNLVLALTFRQLEKPVDSVFMYDWIQTSLKCSFTAPNASFAALLFLTPTLVLLPNSNSNSLDIYEIPSIPLLEPPTPKVSLSLPQLSEGKEVFYITCRAEPNVVGWDSPLCPDNKGKTPSNTSFTNPYAPKRAFLASAKDAICIFSIRVGSAPVGNMQAQGGLGQAAQAAMNNQGFQFIFQPGQNVGNLPPVNVHFVNEPSQTFTFVIHRRAILDVVETVMGLMAEDQHAKDASCSQDGQGGARVNLDEATDVAGSTSQPDPTTRGSTSQAPEVLRIPYSIWGTANTRWFEDDAFSMRWITTTAGQRCVVLGPGEDGDQAHHRDNGIDADELCTALGLTPEEDVVGRLEGWGMPRDFEVDREEEIMSNGDEADGLLNSASSSSSTKLALSSRQAALLGYTAHRARLLLSHARREFVSGVPFFVLDFDKGKVKRAKENMKRDLGGWVAEVRKEAEELVEKIRLEEGAEERQNRGNGGLVSAKEDEDLGAMDIVVEDDDEYSEEEEENDDDDDEMAMNWWYAPPSYSKPHRKDKLDPPPSPIPPPVPNAWPVDKPSVLMNTRAFAERVEGRLGFVCTPWRTLNQPQIKHGPSDESSPATSPPSIAEDSDSALSPLVHPITYEGVLLDEERVIGIKTDLFLDRVQRVDVFWFG